MVCTSQPFTVYRASRCISFRGKGKTGTETCSIQITVCSTTMKRRSGESKEYFLEQFLLTNVCDPTQRMSRKESSYTWPNRVFPHIPRDAVVISTTRCVWIVTGESLHIMQEGRGKRKEGGCNSRQIGKVSRGQSNDSAIFFRKSRYFTMLEFLYAQVYKMTCDI